MNLLLLAHLIADGEKASEASSGPVWATWVPATIGLLGSLGVAWWSGRKTDRQMELSKQATPPELTRYKTWVEVSEKYKELIEFERANSFEDTEKEYQEIRASRKAALDRAVWERKVISECSNIQAQKLVMELPESKIYAIHNPDISRGIELSADDYIRSKSSFIIWFIYLFIIIISLVPVLINVLLGTPWEEAWGALAFSIIIIVLLKPMFLNIFPNRDSGALEANFCIRKMRIEFLENKYNLLDKNYDPSSLRTNEYWEKKLMAERLRYSILLDEWADYVHCPWVGKVWYENIWHKFWCYFCPGCYVRRSLKGKTKVLWGSYKDDKLNGDLKEKIKFKKKFRETLAGWLKKLGCEDAQTPNSNVQEESQPTHLQG